MLWNEGNLEDQTSERSVQWVLTLIRRFTGNLCVPTLGRSRLSETKKQPAMLLFVLPIFEKLNQTIISSFLHIQELHPQKEQHMQQKMLLLAAAHGQVLGMCASILLLHQCPSWSRLTGPHSPMTHVQYRFPQELISGINTWTTLLVFRSSDLSVLSF